MAKFEVTDPETGRRAVVEGVDSADEAERQASAFFAKNPAASKTAASSPVASKAGETSPSLLDRLAAGAGPEQGESVADFGMAQNVQNVMGSVRGLEPMFIGTGATIGALATGVTGPGALIGGALGAAAGKTLFDPLVDLGRQIGVVGPDGPIIEDPSSPGAAGGPLGIASRGATEASIDLAAPGVLSLGKRALVSSFKKIAATTSSSALRIQQYAADLGIPLAVENLSDRAFIRSTRETLGKFPFFSKPFKQLDIAQGEGLEKAQSSLLHSIAPIATTVTDTGTDLSARALRRSRAMRRVFNHTYESLLQRADSEGARIPTRTVRRVAQDIVDQFSGELPLKRSGEAIDTAKANIDTGVVDFANELTDLAEHMTPRQFKRFQTLLNDLISANRDNPTNAGRAMALRKALESDFDEILGSTDLVSGLRAANAAFRSWASLLERPTAQQFVKANRGVFSVAGEMGQVTSRNPDELFRFAFNAKSADAMRDLGRLVGPRGMRSAVRLHIEEAFRGSFDEHTKLVDLNRAYQTLFGRTGNSSERQALAAALNEAKLPVRVADLDKFFQVAESALEQSPINVSTFISRRATLGGSRALVRALNPGNVFAQAAGSPVGAGAVGGVIGHLFGAGPLGLAIGIVGAFQARRGLSLITTPGALRVATQAMDPNIAISVRSQAYLRLGRLIGREGIRDIEEGAQALVNDLAGQIEEVTRPETEKQIPSASAGGS